MHCPCLGVNVLALCATQRRTQLNVSRMPVACMHRLPLCVWDLRAFLHTLRLNASSFPTACMHRLPLCIWDLCAFLHTLRLNASHFPTACMHRWPLCIWDLCVFLHTLRLSASRFTAACAYRWSARIYGCLAHRASSSRRIARIRATRAPVNRRTACRHARPGR